MSTEVNLLIRGQSNALLFVADGGASELEQRLEASLPDVDIKVLASYGGDDNTIYSGTAFLNWDTDGEQQGLLNVLKAEPASIRDNPTITLWIHNEYDSNTAGVTTDHWVSEVKADAALVRGALGQGAATTPYVFTYVPYNYTQGNSPEAIQAGMRQLSADGGFNASFADKAMDDIAMDGDGYAHSSHMGQADAILIADRLAVTMADTVAGLAGGSVPEPPPVPPPSVDTTPVVTTIGSGSDALVLRISQDVYLAGAQYTVSVDGTRIGGTLTAGASAASGQDDVITVKGDWAAGAHKVTIDFLNDAWGGTAATDRNLHVDGITYNGKAVAGGTGALFSAGAMDFAFTEAAAPPPVNQAPPPPPTGTGAIPALFGTPGTWGQAAKV
ncbi:carbohydrate-binding domain-containing protein, partial [Paeniroseomonas aquatica]